jgi:hypothetical protein
MTVTAQYDLATQLLAGVLAELPADQQPGRACVVPGAVVADDDCCDGQLAVALPTSYLSDGFPGSPGEGSTCGAAYLVQTYVIRLGRCVHTLDEQGNPPSCDQLDADSQLLDGDAQAVLAGAIGVLDAGGAFLDYRLRTRDAFGPAGGCAGVELNLVVGFNSDGC